MERNALSLTLLQRAPAGLLFSAFLLEPTARNQTRHTCSLTHLSDLVQQFVVLLPFLQGAQIATHPSCQGNGAVVPLECVRFFLPVVLSVCEQVGVCARVCELPSGAGTHSGSSSLGSPAPRPHLRVLRDAKRSSGRAGRVCICLLVFCQRRRPTPDFPPRLCLSRLLPAPSVMPTCGSSASPPSPPPPTVSALSLSCRHTSSFPRRSSSLHAPASYYGS